MDTTSLWQGAAARTACLPTLQADVRVDVAIVGAGITGLTLALRLIEAGKRVAILEGGRVGGGGTGHSTGNLYATVDLGLAALERARGLDACRQVAAARAAAIDFIEATVRRLGLSCAFARVPWHVLAVDVAHAADVEREHGAALRAGLAAELLRDAPIAVETERALRIPGQAQFQPVDYARQLARHLAGSDCLVFENTRVLAVDDGPSPIVHTLDTRVLCDEVVLATHTPAGIRLAQAQLEVVREYAIGVPMHDAAPEPGIYWTLGPGAARHSLRTSATPERTQLVVVGAAHPTGEREIEPTRWRGLESFARDHFPLAPVEYRWSAQRYRSKDGLPFIGRDPDAAHTWIATGFSSDGLTWGSLAGLLIADELLGRGEYALWRALFRAGRLAEQPRPRGFERTGAAPPHEDGGPVLDRAHQEALATLPPGQSRKVDVAGHPVAVYRDDDDRLHAVGATCTHMGCGLKWNGAETSWDCPCHGSRFTPDGAVLEGPALAPLARARFDPPLAD